MTIFLHILLKLELKLILEFVNMCKCGWNFISLPKVWSIATSPVVINLGWSAWKNPLKSATKCLCCSNLSKQALARTEQLKQHACKGQAANYSLGFPTRYQHTFFRKSCIFLSCSYFWSSQASFRFLFFDDRLQHALLYNISSFLLIFALQNT